MHEQYDVFLCHASEDKEDIAKPIFEDLSNAGIIVFLDDKYIKWGDSFVEKINHALGKAKYVIAILSSNSVTKAWPVKEINASIAREIVGKQKFLPLMVGDGKEIQSFQDEMPLISDKKYLIWKNDTSEIVDKIKSLMSSK
jgi:RNA-directed DNA polymerase